MDNPFTLKDVVTGFNSSQISNRLKALLFGQNIFKTPLEDTPNFIAVTPPATIPVNWLPKGKLFSWLSAVNDRLVYKAIRKTVQQYNIEHFIYLNSFNPLYGNHFPKDFKPDISIYHCVDDISKSSYVSKHGTRLEECAIRRAGLTITTSTELKRLKSAFTEHIHLLPNAANVSLFRKAAFEKLEKPEEIARLPEGREIIIYIGNICHRLDYELLVKIAETYPDKTLMMVGPLGHKNYKRYGLDKKENVMFTGGRKLEELPAYLQYSQCAIIPFLCNTLTKSIYPLKVNEYLSAGKPVITTPFSEDVTAFSEVVKISNNHDEFIDNIGESLVTNSEEMKMNRVKFSAKNSWEDRADRFWKIVDAYQHGK